MDNLLLMIKKIIKDKFEQPILFFFFRLGAMSIILFIVAASLFQTVLEITHPVLLALSASSRNISSHFKVLVLCLLLCLVPAYMSHLLISTVGKIRIFFY